MDKPTQKEVLDGFHAYQVRGKHPSGEPTQEQLDYYSARPRIVMVTDFLDYNHNERKRLIAEGGTAAAAKLEQIRAIVN